MKQVLPDEVKAGRRYRIVQEYIAGTKVITEGVAAYDAKDEYVFIRGLSRLNLHPYVGMPNVFIYEV